MCVCACVLKLYVVRFSIDHELMTKSRLDLENKNDTNIYEAISRLKISRRGRVYIDLLAILLVF